MKNRLFKTYSMLDRTKKTEYKLAKKSHLALTKVHLHL